MLPSQDVIDGDVKSLRRFAHATIQFLGFGGVGSLEWWMLRFRMVIISTILVLLTKSTHIMVCVQFGKH